MTGKLGNSNLSISTIVQKNEISNVIAMNGNYNQILELF